MLHCIIIGLAVGLSLAWSCSHSSCSHSDSSDNCFAYSDLKKEFLMMSMKHQMHVRWWTSQSFPQVQMQILNMQLLDPTLTFTPRCYHHWCECSLC